MKVVAIFALACIAATYSAPAVKTVDCGAIGTRFRQLYPIFRDTVHRSKDLANADNPDIGSEIAALLNAASKEVKVVLAAATAQVDNQSLALDDFMGYSTKLNDIFAGVLYDNHHVLAQLSPATAYQILDIFYSAYANFQGIFQEINALLAE